MTHAYRHACLHACTPLKHARLTGALAKLPGRVRAGLEDDSYDACEHQTACRMRRKSSVGGISRLESVLLTVTQCLWFRAHKAYLFIRYELPVKRLVVYVDIRQDLPMIVESS